MTAYSLGAEQITITYLTQDLTEKTGRYWTFSLNASINSLVILPTEAHIISLNKVPEVIESSNGQVQLLMSTGLIEVTYVVGVVGTKEHAQIVLGEAERTVTQIKGLGINVTLAEVKLQEATQLFNLGNYGQAETLGYEARDLAIQINQTAAQAMTKMSEAEGAITEAEKEGRTEGLNEARTLLDQAKERYTGGDYEKALLLATQSMVKATETTRPFPLYQVLSLFFTVLFGSSLIILKSRKKSKIVSLEKEEQKVDVEKIFKRHDLREDERKAIKLLAERGGQTFEAELYKELGLPRTSTWRMVRRLVEMGIVEVKKFRE